jgi:hypothetical protein
MSAIFETVYGAMTWAAALLAAIAVASVALTLARRRTWKGPTVSVAPRLDPTELMLSSTRSGGITLSPELARSVLEEVTHMRVRYVERQVSAAMNAAGTTPLAPWQINNVRDDARADWDVEHRGLTALLRNQDLRQLARR